MQRQGDEMWEQPWTVGDGGAEGASSAPLDGDISLVILEHLNYMPDIRTELVIFLRRAIEENRYYVPEELVAERMISCGLVHGIL